MSEPTKQLRVLITDDSKTVRKVISKTLEMSGIEVSELYEARTGRDAMAVVEQHTVDLMSLDLHMPDMDGGETVEMLAEMDRLDDIVVIMVSSDRSKERIQELLGQGVRAFIVKPFRPADIKNAVDALLQGDAK